MISRFVHVDVFKAYVITFVLVYRLFKNKLFMLITKCVEVPVQEFCMCDCARMMKVCLIRV